MLVTHRKIKESSLIITCSEDYIYWVHSGLGHCQSTEPREPNTVLHKTRVIFVIVVKKIAYNVRSFYSVQDSTVFWYLISRVLATIFRVHFSAELLHNIYDSGIEPTRLWMMIANNSGIATATGTTNQSLGLFLFHHFIHPLPTYDNANSNPAF